MAKQVQSEEIEQAPINNDMQSKASQALLDAGITDSEEISPTVLRLEDVNAEIVALKLRITGIEDALRGNGFRDKV